MQAPLLLVAYLYLLFWLQYQGTTALPIAPHLHDCQAKAMQQDGASRRALCGTGTLRRLVATLGRHQKPSA